MPILVRNVRLNLDEPPERLAERVAGQLRLPREAIRVYAPVRRSIDARKSEDVHFVYHVELALHDGIRAERNVVQRRHSPNVVPIRPAESSDPIPGAEPLHERPVIVGFGPAGMFAALRLCDFGYRPIVLERGVDVRRRHRDVLQKFYREGVFNPESNLLFGEGGAGTYSDGKLYTRVGDPLVRTVLEWFYRHGADPDILTDARPHIGSDHLPTICRRMRRHIERCGGEVRFDSRLDDLEIAESRVTRISVNGCYMNVGPIILALGHSARDTIHMLHQRGVKIEPRPFQIGVRIEHPQSLVDRWQYGRFAGHDRLPPAEYHVVAREASLAGRDCYSFCMCPGGTILPTNEDHGLIATNGASRSHRGGPFANSGLVITVENPGNADHPLAGVALQLKLEARAFQATGGGYQVPAQRASDFLQGRTSDGKLETSYPFGGKWVDVRGIMPTDVMDRLERALHVLERKMSGFAGDQAVITAPETRVSSPVRIPRDRHTRTAMGIENLHVAGEGAGYAGGIISAAVDGIRTADAVISRYAPVR